MSVIEEILRMSKVGCSNKELLGYIYENYDEIDVNSMEMSLRNPKSAIMIFALTATWRSQ